MSTQMNHMGKVNLNGKVALVTGCNKGIGWGMTLGLASAGADIIGVVGFISCKS